MIVPFLDLKSQYNLIKAEINLAITEVLENTAFILGKSVKNFEIDFAKAHNVKNCVGVSSGTDGNHLALWSLGVAPGDEVIIPANTFIATAWGATLCGAKPVFVDCDKESYNINPNEVENAITKRTKAIVAVHLYGQPADMDKLNEIAQKNNIHLVEDCAQAHLAEYKGKMVGGLSEISSFSFYPGKNLGAYGEAGAVLTDNDALAELVIKLREHGQSQKYYHATFGHNYRMEGIQGAVLNVKLKYLNNWTNARRTVADKYNNLLSKISQLKLPTEMEYGKHVYHLYVVRIISESNDAKNQEIRDQLQDYLKQNGVSTGLHYPIPLHLQECFKDYGYKKGDFPITENLASTGISLPMFPELTEDQIQYTTELIKNFFK